MDTIINEIIDCLSKFIDYIETFTQYSRERDNAIQRLEEAVFWLTYLNDCGD